MTGALPSAPPEVERLEIEDVPRGSRARRLVRLTHDALGRALCVPVLIARGRFDGPVFGVTAAVHGNELNGIPTIHRLFEALEPDKLHGTVVGCPIVNVPAYMAYTRTLKEGMDLNRLMPGAEHGHVGQRYAFQLRTRLIERLDYLVDLHTASFGRVNSLYVRANLAHPVARQMAIWQGPEIIVHNEAGDGTVREAAMDAGIPAITVEVGDPQRFQRRLVRSSVSGLLNVLTGLGLQPHDELYPTDDPVVCDRSHWVYASHGGLLEVFPGVSEPVRAGERFAKVTSVFGDPVAEYRADTDAIVVGKSTNPVCESGARVVHLGRVTTLDGIAVTDG